MYCSGDSEEPRPKCARIVLRGMLEWQAVAVAAVFRRAGQGAPAAPPAAARGEAAQLRLLKGAYPEDWHQYSIVEAGRKLGGQEEADEGGELEPETERLVAEETGAAEVDGADGPENPPAKSSSSAAMSSGILEARRQFADARTAVRERARTHATRAPTHSTPGLWYRSAPDCPPVTYLTCCVCARCHVRRP